MPVRTINHPDIEVREIDKSQYADVQVGTNFAVFGFSQKGNAYEVFKPSSMSQYVELLGRPESMADKYLYNAVDEIITKGGNCFVGKLPYDNTKDKNYKYIPLTLATGEIPTADLSQATIDVEALAALDASLAGGVNDAAVEDDVISVTITTNTDLLAIYGIASYTATATVASGAASVTVGTLAITGLENVAFTSIAGVASTITDLTSITVGDSVDMTNDDFDSATTAEVAPATLTGDFVIVDESKSVLEGANETDGRFIVVGDFLDAVVKQAVLSNGVDEAMNLFSGVKFDAQRSALPAFTGNTVPDSLENYTQLHTNSVSKTSVSRDIASKLSAINYTSDGSDIKYDTKNELVVAVCRQSVDANAEGKRLVTIEEIYVGTLKKGDKDPLTKLSTYLPDLINSQSSVIKMFAVNKAGLEAAVTTVTDDASKLFTVVKGKSAQMLDFSAADANPKINGSEIVNDLKVMFDKLKDINEIQLDVIVDAGLSTIAQALGATSATYVDTAFTDVVNNANDTSAWRAVVQELTDFCQFTRKDCMAILDTPRNLELEGAAKILRKTKPSNTFFKNIAKNLRYVLGVNSSYAAEYANWRKVYDAFTGVDIWLPPTISTAGVYANNDRVGERWTVPAGQNRGVLGGVSELAFNPTGTDADSLYEKSVNYARFDSSVGFTLEGQRTTQLANSAMRDVNVRRTFLYISRFVRNALRPFVYESNNFSTRQRAYNTLEPFLTEMKQRGGIVDFKLVVDASINPAEVIDRGELRAALFIKPTRAISFILVDIIATDQGSSFNEQV